MEDYIDDISDEWGGEPEELTELCKQIRADFVKKENARRKFRDNSM